MPSDSRVTFPLTAHHGPAPQAWSPGALSYLHTVVLAVQTTPQRPTGTLISISRGCWVRMGPRPLPQGPAQPSRPEPKPAPPRPDPGLSRATGHGVMWGTERWN